MGEIRDNISPLSGMAALAAAFLIVYAATTSLIGAAIVAVLAAVGIGLVVRGLFPANADLREYNLDARRRVKKVFASVEEITSMAKQVTDTQAQKSLLDGCKIIPQLLTQTRQQETTSFRLASTAASVQGYLTSVESVLEVYLRIQANPDYFPGAAQQLSAGGEGFAGFESFALKSIQQLNSGDTQGYAANLETLKPLSLPELPDVTAPAGAKV
jgi:hypothetical protein